MKRQHDTEKYELSDAEKRDLIKLIQEDKPLSEKYGMRETRLGF